MNNLKNIELKAPKEQPKKEYKFYILREDDLTIFNPREFDNLTTMICWSSDYNLGDEHSFKCPFEFLNDLASRVDSYRAEIIEQGYIDEHIGYEEACKSFIKIIEKEYTILPLYLYNHSGLKISLNEFTCKWDSGQCGYVYIKNNEVVSGTLEDIKIEVEAYNNYLEGDVYRFVIDEYCDGEYMGEYDGCGGFFGNDIYKNGMFDHIPEYLNIELPSSDIYYYLVD
jgi:hypothetical protein